MPPTLALIGPAQSIAYSISLWLDGCVGQGINVGVTCTPVSATFHLVMKGGQGYYLSGEYTCDATGRSFNDQVSAYVSANGDITAISTGT